MRRAMGRSGVMLIVFALVFSLVAACSGKNDKTGNESDVKPPVSSASPTASESASPSASPEEKPDISKKVEVIMYLAGDGTADSPKVEAEINKLLEKDLNATLKIINIPWADWATKYPLILTSGEKYDLIYASNWAGFGEYARKGSFMAIDELLPKYAPGVMEQLPAEAWKEVTVNGKIVGIPSYQTDYLTSAMVIRGDLREKYSLPPVTDMDSLEAYLDAVKQNEPNLVPFTSVGNEHIMMNSTSYESLNGLIYAYSYEGWKEGNVDYMPFMEEFESLVLRMKRWNDKGYFPKGLLTNKVTSYNAYEQGQSALGAGNTSQIFNVIANTSKTHPEWKSEFASFTLKTKAQVHKMSFMADGMAVGRNAQNPERALMILDKFRTDQTYYNLLHYGVEGVNYVINADGLRDFPEGVTPDKNGYLANNNGQWGFTVSSMEIPDVNEWPGKRKDVYPLFDEFATPDIMATFTFNQDAVKSEVAAISQLYQQYILPLMWGFSKDPQKDLETVRSKLKAAGSDKVLEELKKQLAEYFK